MFVVKVVLNPCLSIFQFLKIQIISDEAGSYFRGIVEDTVKAREERGIVRPDLLHLLLQARKGEEKQVEKLKDADGEEESNYSGTCTPSRLSDNKRNVTISDKGNFSRIPPEITNEDITAHALVFFIGGLESVSSSISFTLYELAINLDIQRKLRKEVLTTLKECEGKVTYEAILDMKYLDMVVSGKYNWN